MSQKHTEPGDSISPNLEPFSDTWNKAMDEIKQEQERYWDSLSKDDQLKAFCAVCRRIYQGEIEDKGSYRYVLYTVFGFGPEAYARAQLAGYLSIHNSIFDYDELGNIQKTIEDFCTNHLDITNDNLKEQIRKYISEKTV